MIKDTPAWPQVTTASQLLWNIFETLPEIIIVDHKAIGNTCGILYIGPLPYTKQCNKLNRAIILFLPGEGTTHHVYIVTTHEAKRKPQNPALENVLMGVPFPDPEL